MSKIMLLNVSLVRLWGPKVLHSIGINSAHDRE
jgi:hypothetical protein